MLSHLELQHPGAWGDYELIDCGDGEKLERFGKQILIRPEPQAVWERMLPSAEWEKQAHAIFRNDSRGDSEKGEWSVKRGGLQQWQFSFPLPSQPITLNLSLTPFRHVGVFPEQAANWRFIYEACASRKRPKVLNMFAYTGAASLVAAAGGAEITHLDALKQLVTWARENMESSGLKDIRWVVEDAMLFAKREVKRGKQYEGIILDPPAYGRGPNGERWLLDEMINELVLTCSQLLAPNGFLVLNMYSMGFSPLVARNLVWKHFQKEAETGELFLPSRTGFQLPMGTFARFK
jgi:23S rRNA (cytosine1962-C5)-methyltransferase